MLGSCPFLLTIQLSSKLGGNFAHGTIFMLFARKTHGYSTGLHGTFFRTGQVHEQIALLQHAHDEFVKMALPNCLLISLQG